MEYIQLLESGSSPKIRKAAEAIIRKKLEGYCPYLLKALKEQIDIPKRWNTQIQIIQALGITDCADALPTLKQLVEREFESTVLYRELGFSIFVLENREKMNLDFFYQSIQKKNKLQIAGACSGILYKKIIPPVHDMRRIISDVAPYTQEEGQVTSPRTYIAALAHLWPKEETKDFLESCRASTSNMVREIAEDALQGKPTRYILV